MLYILQ